MSFRRYPNTRVSNDIVSSSVRVTNSLNVGVANVACPSTSYAGSKIFSDGTYTNANITGVLSMCGVKIAPGSSDVEWDAYRQNSVTIINSQSARSIATPSTVWSHNTDENDIPQYIGMFSKSLNHDAQGRVVVSDYELLRDGIVERDITKISNVPIGGTTKLVQPLGAFTLNVLGTSPSAIPIPAAPSVASAEAAGEVVEVYCQVLCRDVAFVDYGTDVNVGKCVGYLNALGDYRGAKPVTRNNIFRGIGYGEDVGPYVSQLFYLTCTMWPFAIPNQVDYPTRSAANNRMVTSVNYLSAQNGTPLEATPTLSGTPTYLSTGRDLAYNVQFDLPGQWSLIMAMRLRDNNAPFSPTNPYLTTPLSNNQGSFLTWSFLDVATCLTAVAQTALMGAWYAKWAINRRLRPEAYGNEVEQYRLTSQNPANLHDDVLLSGILADIFALQGNYYLAQAYKGGCPAHPSYPAGHATCVGAEITIIKAFFDDTWVFPSPVAPNTAGTVLGAIGDTLTLSGELNKFASNTALGRDWAGYHYRSDGHEGILLGEQIAIKFLQEWINRYPESNSGFSFKGYLGNDIVITQTSNVANNIQNAS